MQSRLTRPVIAWALYDWANSAFATTVMAGFFPIFFKQYWTHNEPVTVSTYYLGLGNSLASLILALMAPVLGAIADVARHKKRYLAFFAVLGVLFTTGLFVVDQGQWPLAITFYALASLGFAGGNIFYDALLPLVAKKNHLDFASGLGYSLGYLGGGLLFTLNVAMTLKPHWFGLTSAKEAVLWSFVSVAVWWTLFSLPLFAFVREEKGQEIFALPQLVRVGFGRLTSTFKVLKADPTTLLFLCAYLFYIDGVNTIVKMAVDYGMALGFDSQNLIVALLITQYVGFPAAIAFGFFGEWWGARKGIFFCLGIYAAITIWGYFMNHVGEFYAMAATIGLVQGGVQSLSRSYFAQLIPMGHEAEYFGFFNMLGKFSAIIGPFLVGWVSLQTNNPRLSILVILIFFVVGSNFLALHARRQNLKLQG